MLTLDKTGKQKTETQYSRFHTLFSTITNYLCEKTDAVMSMNLLFER